jgi:hypothetical protein
MILACPGVGAAPMIRMPDALESSTESGGAVSTDILQLPARVVVTAPGRSHVGGRPQMSSRS